MSWLKNVIRKVMPNDHRRGCGVGPEWLPFRLPLNHPFTRACDLHDDEFALAETGSPDKELGHVDWDIFYRWVLIAKAASTYEEKCKLAADICRYWPYVYKYSGYFWDGGTPKLPSVDQASKLPSQLPSELQPQQPRE
jgi:hypothetical protein